MHAPTLDDFARLGEAALKTIPAELRARVKDVVIRVAEFPDEDVEREMELDSPFDLLGLYVGVALTERGFADTGGEPDRIYLYRRPILDYWCDSGESLEHIVRHVLIHEIGHHFGFSDGDMEAIEDRE